MANEHFELPRRLPEVGLTSEQVAHEMSEREPYVFDDPAEEARFEEAIARADVELEARDKTPTQVAFTWEAGPLSLVRQAAALAGKDPEMWMKGVLHYKAI